MSLVLPEPERRRYLEAEIEGELSPLGFVVAALLDDIWGLHNVRRFSTLRVAKWNHPETIELGFSGHLATFDGNQLTQLVVRGHDACVRVMIAPLSARAVRLTFSRRDRAGAKHERHPMLEEAIRDIRRATYYGFDTALAPTDGQEALR